MKTRVYLPYKDRGKELLNSLFGLGLVLDYQDRATAGLGNTQRAFAQTEQGANRMVNNISQQFNNFQSMMIAGFSFSQLGNGLISAGKNLIKPFVEMGKQVVGVNSKFDTLGATFKTAFGADAEKKMSWVANFAIKTPFQVDDTARALVGLKNSGLDATKAFKDANGQMQPFLQFAGDLATLNMGQSGGIPGMLFAIRNAASGAPGGLKSLQARFDIPKKEIETLKNKTGDAFMLAFSKIANKLTPSAMKNMLGTWYQVISEMKDNWDVFLWSVGKAGAFDPVKRTLKEISNTMWKLFDQDSAKTFASIMAGLWKPIDKTVTGLLRLVVTVKNIINNNPALGKFLVNLISISGVSLIIGGVLFKVAGSFFMFVGSMNIAILTMRELGGTIGLLRLGLSSLMTTILPLTLILGGVYLIWKYNIFNIKNTIFDFVRNVKFSFEYARNILSMNVQSMMTALNNLDKKKDFFSSLTYSLVKFIMLLGGISDAFGDNTLSERNFVRLKELGLLPIIETILEVKARFQSVWKGIVEGFQEIAEVIEPVVNKIGEFAGWLLKLFFPESLNQGTRDFSKETNKIDLNKWKNLGKTLSFFSMLAIGITAASVAMSLFSAVLALSPITWIVLGVIALIAILATLVTHWDTVKKIAGECWDAIQNKIADFKTYLVTQVIGAILTLIQKWNVFKSTVGGFLSGLFGGDEEKKVAIKYTGSKPIGMATGGYIKSEGVALLHPNEVVVNDGITTKLRSFLGSQDNRKITNSRTSHNDNSVVFEKGSIQVSYSGSNPEQDADSFVELVIKKIERKKQINKVRNYQPAY